MAALNIPSSNYNVKLPNSFGSSMVSDSSLGSSYFNQVYENKQRRQSQSYKKNFKQSTSLVNTSSIAQAKGSYSQQYLVDNDIKYIKATENNKDYDLYNKYLQLLQQLSRIYESNRQEQYNIFSRDLIIQSYLVNKAAYQLYQDQTYKENLEIAQILVELNADEECVACALLLGIAQIPNFDLDILKKMDIDPLVIKNLKNMKTLDQLSQLQNQYKFTGQEHQNLMGIFHSLGDQRAVLIKLAEVLQVVRTLPSKSPEVQKQIAEETFQLYVPLAGRLGLRYLKAQLQDGCLEYCTHFQGMKHLKQQYDYSEGQRYVQTCIEKFESLLGQDQEVSQKTVLSTGRSKSYYSILSKIERKQCEFDDIHDLYGLRIVVEDKTTCYRVLRLVQQVWDIEKVKDYIKHPKPNGYQSLHVKAITSDGRKLDIQIRTVKQNFLAEFGVQAHWRYKEKLIKQEVQVQQSVSWCRYVISWLMDIQENVYQSQLPQNKLKDSTIELAHNCRFPEHSKDCKFAKYVKEQGLVPDPKYTDGLVFCIDIKDNNAQVQQCKQGITLEQHLREQYGRYWQLQYQVEVKNKSISTKNLAAFDYKIQNGDIISIEKMESNVQYISKMDDIFVNEELVTGNEDFAFI